MGGYGSGRYGCRATTSSCYSLDVNKLNRSGTFTKDAVGWSGKITWPNEDGDTVASIGIKTKVDTIELNFAVDGNPKNQSVWIDRTPCHFGGSRPWFRCPFCMHRVGRLYVANDGFACRKCYNLTYSSTRMDAVDRTWRKIRKLEGLIIDGDVVDGDGAYHKPKGMHLRTFYRICDELNALEERNNELFIIGAKRILGW